MKSDWQTEFGLRMANFRRQVAGDGVPVSIKVRVVSGCFHRAHSPAAYELIDKVLASDKVTTTPLQFEEHESGPEILVYLAVTTAGLSLAKSVVELITAIIKARSEGIRKGDRPAEPLELIIRGHTKEGEYIEEQILRIPSGRDVSVEIVEQSFPKHLQVGKSADQRRETK